KRAEEAASAGRRRRRDEDEREHRVAEDTGEDEDWRETPNRPRRLSDGGGGLGPFACRTASRKAHEPEREPGHGKQSSAVAREEEGRVQPRGLFGQGMLDPREDDGAPGDEKPEEHEPERHEAREGFGETICAGTSPTRLREIE